MTKYGYIKVIDGEEIDEATVALLTDAGCEHIFIDRVSKASDKRAEFAKMISLIGHGDMVVFGELSQLFRSSTDLKEKVKSITDCGAHVNCLTQPWLNTMEQHGIVDVFDGLLKFEKSLLADRVRAGMEVAKSKGVELGRPTADVSKVQHAVNLYETGMYSVPEICHICDVSKSTLYRTLRKQGKVKSAY